jgi:hypothetical protein
MFSMNLLISAVDPVKLYFLACLWQKDFNLPRPSSRDECSTANVTRSQFFSPTVTPAWKFVLLWYLCGNLQATL